MIAQRCGLLAIAPLPPPREPAREVVNKHTKAHDAFLPPVQSNLMQRVRDRSSTVISLVRRRYSRMGWAREEEYILAPVLHPRQ